MNEEIWEILPSSEVGEFELVMLKTWSQGPSAAGAKLSTARIGLRGMENFGLCKVVGLI